MNEEKVFELKPKFNIFYEMAMPTGLGLARNFIAIIILLTIFIATMFLKNIETFKDYIDIINTASMFILIIMIVAVIVFVIRVIVQVMQYDRLTYSFYDTYLEYKDTFLNKHSKKIIYSNVREVELQRTVFDRIMGYGKVILYTNAEKLSSSALFIFALKNSEEEYRRIDEIIHKK